MSKKKKPTLFLDHITVPIFKQKINLVFTRDGVYAALAELKFVGDFAELFHEGNLVEAETYLREANAIVVRIKDMLFIILPFTVSRGVIAHEIVHLSTAILAHRGIKFCDETEEAYAYVIDWLTEEIYSHYDILKKKML